MTLILKRPESKVVVSALDGAGEKGLWVRGRDYRRCICEYSLSLHGVPLSIRAFKNELNSLIFKKCAVRIRWSPSETLDENGQPKLIRLNREDRRDYYTSLGEHWQYRLVPSVGDLLRQSDQREETPYFVS